MLLLFYENANSELFVQCLFFLSTYDVCVFETYQILNGFVRLQFTISIHNFQIEWKTPKKKWKTILPGMNRTQTKWDEDELRQNENKKKRRMEKTPTNRPNIDNLHKFAWGIEQMNCTHTDFERFSGKNRYPESLAL